MLHELHEVAFSGMAQLVVVSKDGIPSLCNSDVGEEFVSNLAKYNPVFC